MEELFRFIMTRPAERVPADDVTVPIRPNKQYMDRLKAALNGQQKLAAMRSAARAQRGEGVTSVADLTYGPALAALESVLDGKREAPLAELHEAVRKAFAMGAAEVVADAEFTRDVSRLSDAIVTDAVLGNEGAVQTTQVVSLLRTAAVVQRIAADDQRLEQVGALEQAMQRPLLLPGDLFPLLGRSASGPSESASQPRQPTGKDDLSVLRQRRDVLFSTYTALTRIAPEQLVETAAASAPVEDRPKLLKLPGLAALAEAPAPAEQPVVATASGAQLQASASTRSSPAVENGEQSELVASAFRVSDLLGSGAHSALRMQSAPMVLKRAVAEAFAPEEAHVLEERGLDLTRVNLPTAVDRLAAELQTVELELAELETPPPTTMMRIGSTYVPVAIEGGVIMKSGSMSSAVPSTYGAVAPAGIGDLLVVKQSLKRYEARELAHVENILKGEHKERSHRRARTTEETLTIEIETKREEERDHQTTERFELKSEAGQVLKEDYSLKIGAALSGKYGPVVEFKTSADFAMNNAKEESKKIATSYSKDVTTRATNRIFERRREERILKTIEVFEEKNTHGIDNKAGADHVVGQYQWIDKLYEAQVFNYGKRLLFDVMLPEPAAFLLHATTTQPAAGSTLVKPTPFTLRATDITEGNYTLYAKQYEAVGLDPAPQPYLSIGKALEGKGSKDDGVTKTVEIPIPDQYQAVYGYVGLWYTRWPGGQIDVGLGKSMRRFSDNDYWNPVMSNQTGSVAFTLKTLKVEAFTAAIEVTCQRTPRALEAWKLKTHAAILQAYQKQLRDYEERLAAAQIEAASQVRGRNPLENERMIRAELKKGALSVFTAQHFDMFGAISNSPQGYPQPNLTEADAEGRYIRFFEQAFEWEQMMYFFYPYFWGRKQNWKNRALLQEVDPAFAEFIKAGSARVVVSVRPGFEDAVAHFLQTGAIWDGGDLPDITSPLYVSIIQEIRERDQAPGAEIPQGDPWDVRLPTTLVRLRDQPALPAWEKNAAGEWLPV
jgi:hypothetical protein